MSTWSWSLSIHVMKNSCINTGKPTFVYTVVLLVRFAVLQASHHGHAGVLGDQLLLERFLITEIVQFSGVFSRWLQRDVNRTYQTRSQQVNFSTKTTLCNDTR
jgi:heme/copper-type cytochrome/quinol oxidase subunit 3